jgi:NADH-quinone oxidoreductase subunit N
VAGDSIDDLRGLIHRSPGHAIWMLIFLVSLAGIPPAAGFLGKYYIFLALVETGHLTLAIIGCLFVAVALYYYFRIVRNMFEVEAEPAVATTFDTAPDRGWAFRGALAITGLATVIIGLYPEPFIQFAKILAPGA